MKPLTIEDCMSTNFATIFPEMLVVQAAGELIKKDMLGGPVINKEGGLVGWISEQECLQVGIQVLYHNERVASVADVMRTDTLLIHLDDDPLEVALSMLQNKPKSYPVVDDGGKVIGVVTRRYILKMFDERMQELSKPGRNKKEKAYFT